MSETIVLIHGLWMTPLSWEGWNTRFTDAGHTVLAPAPFARLGVKEIADHYEGIIRALDQPPIIMGHSFGGLVTQILLDRGLGAAGVAVDPAAPKGVLVLPPAQLRVASIALKNPANRHKTQMLSPEQFHYAFCNVLSESESQKVYERYCVPGPGRPLFQAGLATFNPKAVTKVDYMADRAPLLLLGGGKDHTVPAAVTRANFKLQKRSPAVTEYKEYADRCHYTVGQEGWEAVADHALQWSVSQAAKVAVPR
jgi:pimeloyl-ACP methyl ester carboxylesterase